MISEAQLNTLFDAARNTKPLISQEDITWFVRYGVPEARTMRQPVLRLYPAIALTVIFCAAFSYWMFVQDRIWSPAQAPTSVAQQESASPDARTAPSTGLRVQPKQNSAAHPDARGGSTLRSSTPNNPVYVRAPQFKVSFAANWVKEKIEPVQPSQLSAVELQKLGITLGKTGMALINVSGHPYTFKKNEDGNLVWGVLQRSVDGVSIEKLRKVNFKPVLMTDTKGKIVKDAAYFYDSLACKNIDKVNRFIPIEITLTDIPGTRPDKYVLWFDRTPDVMRSMPARIKKSLGATEFQSNARYAANEGAEYRIDNIELDADKTFAQIHTLAAMNTPSAFTIYDIQGKKLESNGTNDSFKPTDVSLSFAKLEPGIYQFALQTDAGSQFVQRMVVTAKE